MTHLDEYLDLVLPWDGDDVDTFEVASHRFTDADGKSWFANAGATTKEDFKKLIYSRGARGDVWVALATYQVSKQEMTKDGYHKIKRMQANVARLKTLYLDIDVGKDGGYPDTATAYSELMRWTHDVGIPPATLIVESGSGGMHVYWAMHTAIAQARWKPLAHALANAGRLHNLLFDSQCTVDSARILRPPETYNHKTMPPRPVLMHKPGAIYMPEELEAALSRYSGPKLVSQTLTPQSSLAQNFTAGVALVQAPPVDLYEVADAGCGVIADALDTGGASHKQPLWNLLMLAATFDQDPSGAAHAMSEGHPQYVEADTDAMLARKQQEQQAQNLGWPTCKQFNLLHGACASCQFLPVNKTPFHIVKAPAPQRAPPPSQGTFPAGYWQNGAGMMTTEILNKKSGEKHLVQILDYAISDGALTDEQPSQLTFKAVIAGRKDLVGVPVTAITPADVARELSVYSVMVKQHQQQPVREFLVAWSQRLQELSVPRLKPAHLGWDDKGQFCYAGRLYGKTSIAEAYVSDARTMANYTPRGDLAPWKAAAQITTSQNAPQLEAILASGFAGPLVKLTGQSGLWFSAISSESGRGKTTAVKTATAIFGHPKAALNDLSDTENGLMNKLSTLRNITVGWDEIKFKEDIDKFLSVAFRLGQGKDKLRLDRSGKPRPVQTFETMLTVCSNQSLAAAITRATEQTAAGAYRCFEIIVEPTGVVYSASKVDMIICELKNITAPPA